MFIVSWKIVILKKRLCLKLYLPKILVMSSRKSWVFGSSPHSFDLQNSPVQLAFSVIRKPFSLTPKFHTISHKYVSIFITFISFKCGVIKNTVWQDLRKWHRNS